MAKPGQFHAKCNCAHYCPRFTIQTGGSYFLIARSFCNCPISIKSSCSILPLECKFSETTGQYFDTVGDLTMLQYLEIDFADSSYKIVG